MPVPSRRLKDLIEGTVDHYASQRWQALEEVTISWRGSYGYLTGYLSEDDDDTISLCRIQYLGDPDDWAFAIWQASTDSYADSVLLDGRRTGHPNQALDTACTLYLTGTSEQPADPLKDLRGTALVEAFARAGISTLGPRLWTIVHEAGLRPLGMIGIQQHFGPGDPVGIAAVAENLRVAVPLIVSTGVATAEEIGIETFEERLRDEQRRSQAVSATPMLIGAWATTGPEGT